jgi:hypothetical protein
MPRPSIEAETLARTETNNAKSRAQLLTAGLGVPCLEKDFTKPG